MLIDVLQIFVPPCHEVLGMLCVVQAIRLVAAISMSQLFCDLGLGEAWGIWSTSAWRP